ncbi:MAG: c-type cytochrome, partial [Burkholderiales bacterium]|nr:c-type cytochrome [Burkholderiales bacterium]
MSQPHHGSSEESNGANPIKMAIAITIGAFALIIGIVMLAYFAVGTYTVGNTGENANTPEAIAKRIAPVTTLAIDTSKAPAPALTPVAATAKVSAAPMVAVAIPSAVAAAPTAAGGEGVYKNACVACHGAGIAGAPKTGDKAAWTARIAQGKPLLYDHAIRG